MPAAHSGWRRAGQSRLPCSPRWRVSRALRRPGAALESSPAKAAIEAVLGPLRNAATLRERFRNPDRAIAQAAARAAAGALPPDLRKVLREVRDAFSGELDDTPPRAAVDRAQAVLEPFTDAGYAALSLAQSPRALPGLGP